MVPEILIAALVKLLNSKRNITGEKEAGDSHSEDLMLMTDDHLILGICGSDCSLRHACGRPSKLISLTIFTG